MWYFKTLYLTLLSFGWINNVNDVTELMIAVLLNRKPQPWLSNLSNRPYSMLSFVVIEINRQPPYLVFIPEMSWYGGCGWSRNRWSRLSACCCCQCVCFSPNLSLSAFSQLLAVYWTQRGVCCQEEQSLQPVCMFYSRKLRNTSRVGVLERITAV